MSSLYAGFGRADITPMMGIRLQGYYVERVAEGILDNLEINVLALACDERTVVLIAIDHCGIARETATEFRKHISEVTGVAMEAVYIHATHTHTAPFLNQESEDKMEQEYYQFVCHKMADAAKLALEDLKPARMGFGVGRAPDIAFIRRFRMKDGRVRTNPGVTNPDILMPIG